MAERVSRRRFLQGAAAVAAAGIVPTRALASERAPSRAADLVVHNGKVLTMNRWLPRAEAVAIRGGRIIWVGKTRHMRGLIGRHTELLDAGGGTVLPGINDSHLHLTGFGLSFPPFSVDVNTATIEELVQRVADAIALVEPGDWIRGRDWFEDRLGRAPNKFDLDPVSPDNPVLMNDFSFHFAAVNSRVLEMVNWSQATQEMYDAGWIETIPPRDSNGEPTGVFREVATGLVRGLVPPFSQEETSRAIDGATDILRAQGITSMTDPGIGLPGLDLYVDKLGAGELPLRINALLASGLSPDSMQAMIDAYRASPLTGVDPLRLRVAGMKIFADGIPTAAKTAWLREPYLDGTNGTMTIEGGSDEEKVANLQEMIRRAHVAGFQVGTHATGDATIVAVVDGYVKAMRSRRRFDSRHYVIHGDLTPPETLATMARNRIGVNMNPMIKFLLGRLLDPVLGPERVDYQWPYRSALDAGVKVASGSDAPVVPPNWLQGVETMLLREGQFGGVAGEAERITLLEALLTFTSTGAWQDHAEFVKGSLGPGKVGDLCVLSEDIANLDPHDLSDVPVATTVLGGEVVFERSGSSARPAALAGRQQDHAADRYLGGLCCEELTDGMLTVNG